MPLTTYYQQFEYLRNLIIKAGVSLLQTYILIASQLTFADQFLNRGRESWAITALTDSCLKTNQVK